MVEGQQSMHLKLKDPKSRLFELQIPPRQGNQARPAATKQEDEASVLCTHCCKSFYNKTALRNHVNMQHGIEIEDETMITSSVPIGPIISGPASLNLGEGRISSQEAKRQVTLASEDISYIIVKTVDGNTFQHTHKSHRSPRATSQCIIAEDRAPVQVSGPFECLQRSSFIPGTICHRVFFDCCEYSLHYRHEHTKRRKPGLRCQVCEKQLDGRGVGARIAPNINPTCSLCGMRCADGIALLEHMRITHARPKPFFCIVCHKCFAQQSGLMQHMRMHTGDRPFPCTICGKAFTQKAGLDQHLRIHTKIKPFRCVVCDKSFSQSVHLRQHMRTHTNIQPFRCEICGRRFKQSSHLNFHVRSHQADVAEMADTWREVAVTMNAAGILKANCVEQEDEGPEN